MLLADLYISKLFWIMKSLNLNRHQNEVMSGDRNFIHKIVVRRCTNLSNQNYLKIAFKFAGMYVAFACPTLYDIGLIIRVKQSVRIILEF